MPLLAIASAACAALLLDRPTMQANLGDRPASVVRLYDTAFVTLATQLLGGGVGPMSSRPI